MRQFHLLFSFDKEDSIISLARRYMDDLADKEYG
jgi:hypothetical protein